MWIAGDCPEVADRAPPASCWSRAKPRGRCLSLGHATACPPQAVGRETHGLQFEFALKKTRRLLSSPQSRRVLFCLYSTRASEFGLPQPFLLIAFTRHTPLLHFNLQGLNAPTTQ